MDYKRLLTQVERTLAQIEGSENRRLTIEQIAETIAGNFRDELGITGGRVYECDDDGNYVLVARFGVSRGGPLGIIVPRDYRPIELVLENGVVVMCSSLGSEYSLESSQTKQGFFTLGIIEGLSGKADFNNDSIVYIHELDRYAGLRVQELSGGRQNPTTGRPPGIRTFPLSKR